MVLEGYFELLVILTKTVFGLLALNYYSFHDSHSVNAVKDLIEL